MAKSFRIPDSYWYSIEDGLKHSGPIFTLTSALEYIDDHDLSPVAVIYWGILVPTPHPCHKSQKDFQSRGGMFVQDFLTAIYG